MAEELDIDSVFKLKVEGLKTELSKRGLPKSGSKAELQERLLQFVTTQEENDVLSGLELETGGGASDLGGTVDDSVLDEAHLAVTPTEIAPSKDDLVLTEEEEEEFVAKQEETNTEELLEKKEPPKPATISAIQSKDKINKVLSPSASEIERKASRTKRFGQAVSEEERKKSRMEKFGGTTEKKSLTDDEKIKQREQRFATSTTTSETAALTITSTNSSTPTSKLQQRSERFADDKIKKRQERFGVVQATTINTDAKTRKEMRAMKFGIV